MRPKSACSATETSLSHEIASIETRDITLSRQWTTKVLIRQRECAGWSVLLLFAYGENGFSHDMAQLRVSFFIFLKKNICCGYPLQASTSARGFQLVPTTCVFMETKRKLSSNYHQVYTVVKLIHAYTWEVLIQSEHIMLVVWFSSNVSWTVTTMKKS